MKFNNILLQKDFDETLKNDMEVSVSMETSVEESSTLYTLELNDHTYVYDTKQDRDEDYQSFMNWVFGQTN